MSATPVDKLSVAERDQLAISYAAFVLTGVGAEITTETLTAVIKASGVAVNAALIKVVAKALKGKSVTEFFGSIGGGATEAAAPVAEKKADKK